MFHFNTEISKTSFRRISKELDRLVLDLRASEQAIHKLLGISDWHKIASDIAKLQEIDRIIQTLDALSLYSTRMSDGVSNDADHTAIISIIKLEAVRQRLSEDDNNQIDARSSFDSSIDIF